MRSLKFRINRKALENIYIAFIRPLLDNSDSVWDHCTNKSKKQLDLIHHDAARIITRATKLCSIEKILADLGWDSLQERRYKHKLPVFFKIINCLTPRYLSEILPPLVQENNHYNLRNANTLYPMHANTNLFFNSFFPSTIRAWNELSDEIKEANTVSAFKYRLNRNKRSPPKYYNVDTRIGHAYTLGNTLIAVLLIHIFFEKNIVASRTCDCGGFESSYHFFFICPRYIGIRNTYLSNILQSHSTNEILFGKETASVNENEILFLKVQDYIIKSRRFI